MKTKSIKGCFTPSRVNLVTLVNAYIEFLKNKLKKKKVLQDLKFVAIDYYVKI
jgi:hypothetical protein